MFDDIADAIEDALLFPHNDASPHHLYRVRACRRDDSAHRTDQGHAFGPVLVVLVLMGMQKGCLCGGVFAFVPAGRAVLMSQCCASR